MTKFIISATLDQDKNLILQNAPRQNQGENNCSAIEISLPSSMASGNDFYLEFLCPKNKRYISPKLTATSLTNDSQKLSCDIPSCVLQEEGFVQLQLVARSVQDNSVVYKSNYSSKAAFFVHASVNATQLFTVLDYFAKIDEALKNTEQATNELFQLKNRVEQYLEATDELIAQKTEVAVSEEKESRIAAVNAEQSARAAADAALQQNLSAHANNVQNPHGVTKAQLGLGNVANERQYSAENPNLSTNDPKMNGIANAGSATTYSRSDHVHPHDSDKADNNNVLKLSLQVLTEAQKIRVRNNIGAGTSSFSGNYDDLVNKPTFNGDTLVMTYGDSREIWIYSHESFEFMAAHGLGRVVMSFEPLVRDETEFELCSGNDYLYFYPPLDCAGVIIETKNFHGYRHFDITYLDTDGDSLYDESYDMPSGSTHKIEMNCYFFSSSWIAKAYFNNIYSEAVYDR